MTNDWQPTPKPVPVELQPGYEHPPFVPEPTNVERMTGIPLMDRLDDTMRNRLLELKGIL